MKVIISGSYHIGDVDMIERIVDESGFLITTVLTGGAPGVETAAINWARLHNIPFIDLEVNRIKYTIPNIRKDRHLAQTADAGIFIIRPFSTIDERGGEVSFLLSEVSCMGKPYFIYVSRTPRADSSIHFDAQKNLLVPYNSTIAVKDTKPAKREKDLFG